MMQKKISAVSRLRTARTYITSVLLNLPIVTTETSVASLLGLLDHYSEHPASTLK